MRRRSTTGVSEAENEAERTKLMTEERRSEERVSTNLQAKWAGQTGLHDARVVDISMGGCFVNTEARVDISEVISLEIKLPSGEWLLLRGEVAAFQLGFGFGLLFTFLTDDEEFALRELIL